MTLLLTIAARGNPSLDLRALTAVAAILRAEYLLGISSGSHMSNREEVSQTGIVGHHRLPHSKGMPYISVVGVLAIDG